jgi:hypothetical protein
MRGTYRRKRKNCRYRLDSRSFQSGDEFLIIAVAFNSHDILGERDIVWFICFQQIDQAQGL